MAGLKPRPTRREASREFVHLRFGSGWRWDSFSRYLTLEMCVTLFVHPSFVFSELGRNLLDMVCRANWCERGGRGSKGSRGSRGKAGDPIAATAAARAG